MNFIFKRELSESTSFNIERCANELVKSGYRIEKSAELIFSEIHSSSVFYGNNGQRLFNPFLKGNLRFDSNKQSIIWMININELLAKSFIVFIMTLVFFGFFVFENYLNLFILCSIIGLIVFGMNWVKLIAKVDALTDQILNN